MNKVTPKEVLEYYLGLPDKEGFYKACGMPEIKYRNHCSIDKALSSLRKIIKEEMPKEKIDKPFTTEEDLKNDPIYFIEQGKIIGYNQALSDISAILDKLLGGGK